MSNLLERLQRACIGGSKLKYRPKPFFTLQQMLYIIKIHETGLGPRSRGGIFVAVASQASSPLALSPTVCENSHHDPKGSAASAFLLPTTAQNSKISPSSPLISDVPAPPHWSKEGQHLPNAGLNHRLFFSTVVDCI
jgi:hypothetical protein